MAGGPVGISIIENQRTGSASKTLVLVARAQITGMLILVKMSAGNRLEFGQPWTYSGHNMKRIDVMKTIDLHGTDPESSPLFILRKLWLSLTPTTMI